MLKLKYPYNWQTDKIKNREEAYLPGSYYNTN